MDFADTDKGLPHPGAIPAAGTGQPPPYNGMQMPPPMHPAAPMHPGQPPVQYAPPPQSSQTPNEQQSALLLQLKSLVQHDPEQARRLLLEKPHLSYMVLDLLWRFALIESKAVEQVIAAGVAGNPGGMGIGMPSPVNMPAPLGLPAAPMQQQPQPHIPSQVPQGGQQQPVYSEEYKAAILKKAAALTPQQFEQLAPDLQRTIQMLRHQQL